MLNKDHKWHMLKSVDMVVIRLPDLEVDQGTERDQIHEKDQ